MAVLSGSRFALDARVAAVALVLVLATGSMPMTCGWVVADSQCATMADICHPAQSMNVSHAPLLAPAPQLFSLNDASRDLVLTIDDSYDAMAGRLGKGPDLPPPNALA